MVDVLRKAEPGLSPILNDQPAEEDHLGFETYVQALYNSIVDENTGTPITLGIFGRWGTGKTTLMKMLAKKFADSGVVTVWFNAWQYSTESELWAAFLQSILKRVQEQLSFSQRFLFNIRLLQRRIRWKDIPGVALWAVLRAVIVVAPVYIFNWIGGMLLPERTELVEAGGALVSVALAVWLVARPCFKR